MPKHVRLAFLPLIAALPLAMTPAHAIAIGSGSAASATSTPAAQPSKKQLKQQRKLAKNCAKLSAGKIKKASKRAKYEKLCAQPTGSTPPVPDGGSGPQLDDDQETVAPDDTDDANSGSQGSGSSAGGGSTAGGGAGAGSAPNVGGPPQDYLDELLDLPPIFTPPPGGAEEPTGDVPQTPVVDIATPTNDVPEPGSLALLGLGLVGLGLARRRAR